jgi:ABC-type glutathione transport system ATPase component
MNADRTQPLVRVEQLVKRYPVQQFQKSAKAVIALDGVSFTIAAASTLAVVGESGSGKSSLALCLACLERPTSGAIWFEDQDLAKLPESQLRKMRPRIQLVFQDPANSFNPRFTVGKLIVEPLVIQRKLNAHERSARVPDLLARVGLTAGLAGRCPDELSGGEKQRVAIARALSLDPQVLILDEALSALDCSVQAQIANLLLELQSALGLTYVFITHDLAMGAHLADHIAVMDRGRIVELGSPEELLCRPREQASRSLVAAIPRLGVAVPELQGR